MSTVQRSDEPSIERQPLSPLKRYATIAVPFGMIYFVSILFALFGIADLSIARFLIIAFAITLLVLMIKYAPKAVHGVKIAVKEQGQAIIPKVFIIMAFIESAFIYSFLTMLLFLFYDSSEQSAPLFTGNETVDLMLVIGFFILSISQFFAIVLALNTKQN